MMTPGRHLGFQRVVFDCDSTLCTIEGIDELARLKGQTERIVELTNLAMDGAIPLEKVYAERLNLLVPTRAELVEVGKLYRKTLVPDAAEVVSALQAVGIDVFIVSGGLLTAVLDLALKLKVPALNVRAVPIEMDQLSGEWWNYTRHRFAGNPEERYLGVSPSPLSESSGKIAVLKELVEDKRVMMVGDGSTDLATKGTVRLFVGYGGVARRKAVVEGAEVFVEGPSLAAILPLALPREVAEKLLGTPHEATLAKGCADITGGRVLFKNDSMRERIARAYDFLAERESYVY